MFDYVQAPLGAVEPFEIVSAVFGTAAFGFAFTRNLAILTAWQFRLANFGPSEPTADTPLTVTCYADGPGSFDKTARLVAGRSVVF